MNKVISLVALFLLTVGISFAINSGNAAQAWKVNHSANSICKEDTARINWSFTNQEPNDPKWDIDLVVTDLQSGKASAEQTVVPGQTVNGVIDTGESKINAGQVSFKMTWTDGRSGIDTRHSSYTATTECETPDPCEWNHSLPADDPNCYEPCEFNHQLPADHENCYERCEFDRDLRADDPNCKEDEPCEYDSSLTADDPNCEEPEEEEEEPQVLPEVTELPRTGISVALQVLGAGVTAGAADVFIRSRRQ